MIFTQQSGEEPYKEILIFKVSGCIYYQSYLYLRHSKHLHWLVLIITF